MQQHNYVSYAEIKHRIHVLLPSSFSSSSSSQNKTVDVVRDFKEMLVVRGAAADGGDGGQELFVGARDYLVKITLGHTFQESDHNDSFFSSPRVELVYVGASEDALQECTRALAPPQKDNEQTNSDHHTCHNYIRVIVLDSDDHSDDLDENSGELEKRLLVCGTNARRPQCTWRSARSPSHLLGAELDGMGRVANVPSLAQSYIRLASDNWLFATAIDYNSPPPLPSTTTPDSNLLLKLDYLIDRSLGIYTYSFISFILLLDLIRRSNGNLEKKRLGSASAHRPVQLELAQ
jgi:hypothetical protein